MACRAPQALPARPVFQGVLDTTGRSDSPVLLDLQALWVLGVCKAILAWKAGTVPWEVRAAVPSTERLVSQVPQGPSALSAHLVHLVRRGRPAALAPSEPTARTELWACLVCPRCTDTGRISGGRAPWCPTSRWVHVVSLGTIWFPREAARTCERLSCCNESEGQKYHDRRVILASLSLCATVAGWVLAVNQRPLALVRSLGADGRQDDLWNVDGCQAPSLVVVPARKITSSS